MSEDPKHPRDWRSTLLSPLIALVIYLLHGTLRVRHIHAERIETLNLGGQPYIISFWHGDLMMMLHSRFRRPISVMSSRHRDGALIANAFPFFGVNVVRGSTSRGAMAALRQFIRAARDGSSLVFTPDGPRGPARKAKSGVVFCAQATGLPIVPIAFQAEHQKILRSWDGFKVPRPFSRALFLYGEPIIVPRKLTEGELETWTGTVECAMNVLTDSCASDFARLYDSLSSEVHG